MSKCSTGSKKHQLKSSLPEALSIVRALPGSSRSLLILATGLTFWVVKFNNPYNTRLALNEFIATSLAQKLGLSVPACGFMEVSQGLLCDARESSPSLGINDRFHKPGIHFASKYVLNDLRTPCAFLPAEDLQRVSNLAEALGAFVLDVWLGNMDWRQVVFAPDEPGTGFRAWWIDQGECFGGEEWDGKHWHGIKLIPAHLKSVMGNIQALPIWVERVESVSAESIKAIISAIPEQLVRGEDTALVHLVDVVLSRRDRIRELIVEALDVAIGS